MEQVYFYADTIKLVGDLRTPPAGGRWPGLVFTGPFTGVRDQITGRAAAVVRLGTVRKCDRASFLAVPSVKFR